MVFIIKLLGITPKHQKKNFWEKKKQKKRKIIPKKKSPQVHTRIKIQSAQLTKKNRGLDPYRLP